MKMRVLIAVMVAVLVVVIVGASLSVLQKGLCTARLTIAYIQSPSSSRRARNTRTTRTRSRSESSSRRLPRRRLETTSAIPIVPAFSSFVPSPHRTLALSSTYRSSSARLLLGIPSPRWPTGYPRCRPQALPTLSRFVRAVHAF